MLNIKTYKKDYKATIKDLSLDKLLEKNEQMKKMRKKVKNKQSDAYKMLRAELQVIENLLKPSKKESKRLNKNDLQLNKILEPNKNKTQNDGSLSSNSVLFIKGN